MGAMRNGTTIGTIVLLPAALGLAGCCTAPSIDLADYAHLREDPAEAVRYFQLAVELGRWEDAAHCLIVEKEEVGPWQLWLMSGMRMREFGDLSLNEIIVGTYFIQPVEGVAAAAHGAAAVAVFSRPKPDIEQRYDLVLVKRDGRWMIDLDKTVGLNQGPE
jgi:hypothetical protein